MQQKDLRNDQAARYAFPSAANSRNKILAINVLLDPPNCLLLLSYQSQRCAVQARDGVAVKFGRDLFPENQFPHALRLHEAAPGWECRSADARFRG